MKLEGSFIVSYSFSDADTGVLIVGKQTKEKMDIVNAFQGKEAMDIFRMISTKKNKEEK